jgi:hypothetical protein
MNSHHIPSLNEDSSTIRDDRLGLRYPFLETETALDDFISNWRTGTLPKSSWTHGAHVAVAACLAFNHAEEEALNLTRAGILHFNTCVGTANTADSGYHETLTRFWSGEVGKVVRAGRFASRLEAVRHAVHRFGEDRNRHRLFYTFDVVKDRRARREWVAPDRSPIMPPASTNA